jgi:hypothetical protein
VRHRTEYLPQSRIIFVWIMLTSEDAMKNAKNISTSKNWNRSLLAAALMFAVSGGVHAQGGSSGEGGGSSSSKAAKTPAKSGSAAQGKSQRTLGGDQYSYGRDSGRDYARSQGVGPSGESSYSYGKDQGSDYARSQGAGTSSGRGSGGMGSSSSQSDYD